MSRLGYLVPLLLVCMVALLLLGSSTRLVTMAF